MSKTDNGTDILLGICGTGGFSREVLPVAREFLSTFSQSNAGKNRIVFVENNPVENSLNDMPGKSVV